MSAWSRWPGSVGVLLVAWAADTTCGQAVLPPGFEVVTVASGFLRPVGIAFSADGRLFVAEQRGLVWVVEGGRRLTEPFIDLREEVGYGGERGMLGIALEPEFLRDRHVFLLYAVDPIYGEPDEPPDTCTFGRLTRYTGTLESRGNVADLDSRNVLIGERPAEGFPICYTSHGVGGLGFAADGTLFVGAGDGAHHNGPDAGGRDTGCFGPNMFSPDQDIGAFRAQYLDSLAGKILRIDPVTGEGVPSNPFWTGDGRQARSKVWVSGLRNPFRFAVRPGSGSPEVVYIGDVGWHGYEEVSVARGGENFGWPCYEGPAAAPDYPSLAPLHSGCDTIGTPPNPGALAGPLVTWHHTDATMSVPPGYRGTCAIGGAFAGQSSYPPPYGGKYYFGDFVSGWVKVLEVDEQDRFVALRHFGVLGESASQLIAHPLNGDLHYPSVYTGRVRRIRLLRGDLDGDADVDLADFLLFQLCFAGPNAPAASSCPPGVTADLDEDGDVDLVDFAFFRLSFTGSR